MITLIQDLKFGLRQLARNPGFAAVAIVTLALGIGANTAMFSVINGVLLRPLPYPHAERMVTISLRRFGKLERKMSFSARGFDFWQEHNKPFQYLAAFTDMGFNLAGAGRAEHLDALRVSSEYFHLYGVSPFLGRDFNAEEEQLGGPNVAILSYNLWKEHFGGSRNGIGKGILLDGAPYTVIGVMPAGFASVPAARLWTTIGQVRHTIGSGWNYDVIGRLKPGVSQRQADAYVASLTQPFLAEFAPGMKETARRALSLAAIPYKYSISENVRTPLLALFGAIGFVLLIACVNVANLLMARGAMRSREIAVRVALGANRARVFRQLLTESVLLAALGGALGLLLAYWGLHFLLALAPADLPRAQHIALDGWALGFTALVAIATGILFGLAPALQASRTDLNESLKASGAQASISRGRRRLSAAMVSGEVALSLVLLLGSGLLIKTFANLLRTNPGFDPHHVLSLQIWTTGSKYNSTPALANFYRNLVHRIDAIPGVKSSAVVAVGLPLERGGNVPVRIAGDSRIYSIDYREITSGYFAAMGVPLLRGRAFTESDSAEAPRVAIVNNAFARRWFASRDPIGGLVMLLGIGPGAGEEAVQIAGVVGDVRSSLNDPAPPTVFIPIAQASYGTDQLFQGWFPTSILVRTSVEPLSLSRAVTEVVRNLDPSIPVGQVRSMEEVLSTSLAFQRFLATLMSLFAGLALLLAAVGIYGVISYSVSQRTHEIGIRMALGAKRRDVLLMVIRQGLVLAMMGLAAGLIAALGLTRLIASMLYGVKPTDFVTFTVASIILVAVVLCACYIPARRAAKVEPMVALRYE